MADSSLFWFRRDLRLADNKALSAALQESARVYCVFVFDTDILGKLTRRADRRVEFILHCVAELADGLAARGGNLTVLHGRPVELIPGLARRLQVGSVYVNRDYEPDAISRDAEVERVMNADGVVLYRFKDQVVFEQDELLTQEGRPYTVFSSYRNAWLKRLPQADLDEAPLEAARGKFASAEGGAPPHSLPSLQSLGFEATNLPDLDIEPGAKGANRVLGDFLPRMRAYQEARDYPAVRGVSYLSVHLRFGTVSVRRLVNEALRDGSNGARTWLSELIWRDFYFSILYLFPHVVGHAFQRKMESLPFTNRTDHFHAWCEGRTGYPLVDAAMRQIDRTGYMHNRLRMVAASFLIKHLQVDWRWGERYFAEHLNDFDLAANNGGWQWSASTGNDAQPWFRIFNPVLQSRRFDPEGRFIRRYVPELAGCSDKQIHEPWKMSPAEQAAAGILIGRDYPAPLVDHAQARQAALRMYESNRATPDSP